MANPLLDRLNELLGRKKKPATPEPAPEPTPEPPHQPGAIDYLKAWRLLKDIQIQKLGKLVSLSAVIVFFAISGVLAWGLVFVKFILTLNR
jgi:hypothetical protein